LGKPIVSIKQTRIEEAHPDIKQLDGSMVGVNSHERIDGGLAVLLAPGTKFATGKIMCTAAETELGRHIDSIQSNITRGRRYVSGFGRNGRNLQSR